MLNAEERIKDELQENGSMPIKRAAGRTALVTGVGLADPVSALFMFSLPEEVHPILEL